MHGVDRFPSATRMTLEFDDANPVTARVAMTVSALNRVVAGSLLRNFPLVRVSGEICNFSRAASGHWHFGLKDPAAQVRCVMFRGRNALVPSPVRDGESVATTEAGPSSGTPIPC